MRVSVNGEICADEWIWLFDWCGIPAFCPKMMRKAIEENPDGEELIVEINSCGGSVFAGFEIYSLLQKAACATVAEVQSLAASAASTIMVGCKKIVLSPVAQVMIHLPSASTEGDVHDHEQSVRILTSLKESILNAYELRCGGKATRERLSSLMEAESWLYPQETIALGLADAIMGDDNNDLINLPKNIRNAVGGGIRAIANSAGNADLASLLKRYEEAVKNGAEPAEGHPVISEKTGAEPVSNNPVWSRKARLEIEKNRF